MNTMLRSILALGAMVSLSGALAGCGGGTSSDDAATPRDAATGVDGGDDAGPGDDAAIRDAGLRDAVVVDAAEPRDAFVAPDTDTARCSYVDVDDVIVLCGTDYTFIGHFSSKLADCPSFYGFDPEGMQYPSVDAVLAASPTCDASCQWHFSTGVDRLYCGRRSGYEVLTATGCADVYRFPEGYYPSVEAHDAANPCP